MTDATKSSESNDKQERPAVFWADSFHDPYDSTPLRPVAYGLEAISMQLDYLIRLMEKRDD